MSKLFYLCMEIDEIQRKIGENIRGIRLKLGLTQQQVCTDQIGMRTFQKIEGGEANLTLRSLLIIAHRMKVHPKIFFDFPMPLAESQREDE